MYVPFPKYGDDWCRHSKVMGGAYGAYGRNNDMQYGWHHAVRVQDQARTLSEAIVAYCHDLIEDDYATLADLDKWGLTPTEIAAVLLVTRSKEPHDYQEYIQSIVNYKDTKAGQIALNVKFYDLCDHLHPSWVGNLTSAKKMKYITAMTTIALAVKGSGDEREEQENGSNVSQNGSEVSGVGS